ncbi:4-coumarate--CoA ligase 1-like isoform X1 [Penaeus monodon]|uniref:4-coumarate--CoA ligase 1-like isoform X1 n=2 Tax=Penaeus monodon TaxID=6687 RepID=UPI0018A6F78B|nr:4-coumarate--CoA ligase 1-like isoform X1 [Penaeus monodon]
MNYCQSNRPSAVKMVAVGEEKAEHVQKCAWENVGDVPNVPFAQYMMEKMMDAGDKVALVDGVSGETLKFSEIVDWMKRVSFGWHDAGLEAGHVVCLVTPNCIQAPAAFLAAIAASAVVTLSNPLYTPDELKQHFTDSKSKWIVVHPLCLPGVQAAIKDLDEIKGVYVLGSSTVNGVEPLVGLAQDQPDSWEYHGVSGNNVVHLPYSSGTTGLPKGVELTSSNWLAVLSTIGRKEYLDVSSDDTGLGILPIFHAFGMAMYLTALSHGMTMVTLPRFIPDIFLKAIQTYKVTLAPLVPPLALFMAKHDLVTKFDLTSITNIICGAASLSGDVQALLSQRLSGVRVRQGYGLTETTLATFSSETDLPGAVGTVTAHCEAKIVDMKTGDSVGPGIDGEICIRGPLIMKGYLNNEEATANIIDAGGWLHTGDIGHYDENGIFFIVDRIKELVKYKGFQVAPAELEGLLVTNENVADAAVVGIKDEEAGELPKAFVVPKPGKTISPEELINWVHDRVAPHKRLRGGVEVIESVPRSPAGKILRRKLREQANA